MTLNYRHWTHERTLVDPMGSIVCLIDMPTNWHHAVVQRQNITVKYSH